MARFRQPVRLMLTGALCLIALEASAQRAKKMMAGTAPILPPWFDHQTLRDEVSGIPSAIAPSALPEPTKENQTSSRKFAGLSPQLQNAVLRIEPIFDPTRLDSPETPPLRIRSGTAIKDSIFDGRWRRLSHDPNVDLKTMFVLSPRADSGGLECTSFTIGRARGMNEFLLTELNAVDCDRLLLDMHDDAASLAPLSNTTPQIAIFASPLPGSRMSSAAFWAQHRIDIAAREERLREIRASWLVHARPPAEFARPRRSASN